MSPRTILTLANLRNVDLLAPVFFPSDADALAEMVAKENRFNGATPGVAYSVAQHLAIGADAILLLPRRSALERATADLAAAYYVIHDLPESIWKDDTTPKKNAIAERVAARCGVMADAVLGIFDEIDDDHEKSLQSVTGLPWPPPPEIKKIVKHMDKVMFVTEWRDLMGLKPKDHPDWSPYEGIEPLKQRIDKPTWTWDVAKRGWLRRAHQLLPALQIA